MFTGYYDSNDNPIHEGDTVAFMIDQNVTGVVLWNGDEWYVKKSGLDGYFNHPDMYTVVGSIYDVIDDIKSQPEYQYGE